MVMVSLRSEMGPSTPIVIWESPIENLCRSKGIPEVRKNRSCQCPKGDGKDI